MARTRWPPGPVNPGLLPRPGRSGRLRRQVPEKPGARPAGRYQDSPSGVGRFGGQAGTQAPTLRPRQPQTTEAGPEAEKHGQKHYPHPPCRIGGTARYRLALRRPFVTTVSSADCLWVELPGRPGSRVTTCMGGDQTGAARARSSGSRRRPRQCVAGQVSAAIWACSRQAEQSEKAERGRRSDYGAVLRVAPAPVARLPHDL
jgi:hypothetical protein